MNLKPFIILFISTCVLTRCTHKNSSANSVENENYAIDEQAFKTKLDNQDINLYSLTGKNNFKVYLTNLGARIVSIITPDKNGNPVDIVLGFKTAAEYLNEKEPYFGTIVGPVANRIAKGKFVIADEEYVLPINNGPNTLHGGLKGLHFVVWDTKAYQDSIVFTYKHKHLQEGFPGNKNIKVTYAINSDNDLIVSYSAISDQDTYINLSNHAYFNLNGEGSGTILNHELQIYADAYTPVDSTLIPTGEIASVKGTPFDFSSIKTIGKDIETPNIQLDYGKGYDHNYVLNQTQEKNMTHASTLIGDKTGIILDIFTTEPGLQFYSGNFMNETVILKNGAKDSLRTGLCLEPQNFPNAANQSNFPNSKLKKGETYHTTTIYSLSTK